MDTFDDPDFGASITFDSGIVSDRIGTHSISSVNSAANRITAGLYTGIVDGDETFEVLWTLLPNTFGIAFEAFQVNAPGALETAFIEVDDGGGPQSFDISDALGGARAINSGFLGFVGMGELGTVRFFGGGGTPSNTDRFDVDDLRTAQFGRGGASEVPVPAAAVLLLSGVVALGGLKRRPARKG